MASAIAWRSRGVFSGKAIARLSSARWWRRSKRAMSRQALAETLTPTSSGTMRTQRRDQPQSHVFGAIAQVLEARHSRPFFRAEAVSLR